MIPFALKYFRNLSKAKRDKIYICVIHVAFRQSLRPRFLNSKSRMQSFRLHFIQSILEERPKGARGTQEGPSLDEFRTKNRRPCV